MNDSVFAKDYGNGSVDYIEYDLKNNIPLNQQEDCLREDLLQVVYADKSLILDVGWYPEGNLGGSFITNVIKDYNWDDPIFRCESTDLVALDACLDKAIEVCVTTPFSSSAT